MLPVFHVKVCSDILIQTFNLIFDATAPGSFQTHGYMRKVGITDILPRDIVLLETRFVCLEDMAAFGWETRFDLRALSLICAAPRV